MNQEQIDRVAALLDDVARRNQALHEQLRLQALMAACPRPTEAKLTQFGRTLQQVCEICPALKPELGTSARIAALRITRVILQQTQN